MGCWRGTRNMSLLSELNHPLRRGSTKRPAPTALRAKIGGTLGAAAQRRRRGMSVEPRGPEIQSPRRAAYSEHQHNALSINDLRTI